MQIVCQTHGMGEGAIICSKCIELAEQKIISLEQLQVKIRARVERFAKLGSWRHDSDIINVFIADLRELTAISTRVPK